MPGGAAVNPAVTKMRMMMRRRKTKSLAKRLRPKKTKTRTTIDLLRTAATVFVNG
jgi:hypothetical protein